MVKRKLFSRTKDRWISMNKTKKTIVIFCLLLVLMMIFVFGSRISLFINIVMGKDIVLKLQADREDLRIINGQESNITFTAGVTTNPFCSASCHYSFNDLSNNITVDSSNFVLKAGLPFQKVYPIETTAKGTGQYLYSFGMECRSIGSLLCPVNEKVTKRNILVTVEHDLNEEEKVLKDYIITEIENISARIEAMYNKEIFIGYEIKILENNLASKEIIKYEVAKDMLTSLSESVEELKKTWLEQDYYLLKGQTENLTASTSEVEISFSKADEVLSSKIKIYNKIADDITSSGNYLEELKTKPILSINEYETILNIVEDFNDISAEFFQTRNIYTTAQEADNVANRTVELYISINNEIIKETLKHEIETDINYDALCFVTGNCIQHPSILERANQSNYNLTSACSYFGGLHDYYAAINLSINYTLLQSPSAEVINIKQNITNKYLSQVPENSTNVKIIKEMFPIGNISEVGNYTTQELLAELIKQQPEACSNFYYLNETINKIEKIKTTETKQINFSILLPEQTDICCVYNKCNPCCKGENCYNDNSTYSIIFIHGHDLNSNIPADYSLDVFNKIIGKLEQENYIDAGAISFYTTSDSTQKGVWGVSGYPLLIKGSYYFDTLKQPENYITFQAKSESIDTYAIRLKDMVDTIKYRTNKPKVTIVTYSMGGLVARRYIQIFGAESVYKLILIGSPNKGIAGKVADYCTLFGGGELECRDMITGSSFLEKLNLDPLPKISIYNIFGQGCNMQGGIGDGIVLEQNAVLDNAKNYLINGTCQAFGTLHNSLIDTDIHPEVYDIVSKALKE